ncbi:hypothetical protein BDV98DRAFT_591848 [Pterulicium gracile]|uniref:Uncharacterized protein n=1 Tax=Pterulicium gracile TaxID=1884261 RepID=A0A5C3QRA5_9AGAR|nr:hypothetical protein BDV98DRAFT_591848 [Pterula gracilis]
MQSRSSFKFLVRSLAIPLLVVVLSVHAAPVLLPLNKDYLRIGAAAATAASDSGNGYGGYFGGDYGTGGGGGAAAAAVAPGV